MKHLIAVLLSLLLCGCAREQIPSQPKTIPEETFFSGTAGLYDPDHPIEQQYPGLVRAYPLTIRDAHGILPMGKDILVLSGQNSTTLTRFTGDTLLEVSRLTLDFPLAPDDPSLQIHENGISFFDPTRQVTILLDNCFQEIHRITAPAGLSGKPILSRKEDTLYYCTGWAVVAWDLDSGIRRTVKEMAYEKQELTALHLDGRVLECSIRDKDADLKLLLSADQGLEYSRLPSETILSTGKNHYFTAFVSGYQTLLIFGNMEDSPELLLPDAHWEHQTYLSEDHGVITVSASDDAIRLDYYELNTGLLRTSLSLGPEQTPKSIVNSKDHAVYILIYDPDLDCDILYRWDPLREPPDAGNRNSFKTGYHSQSDPDPEALEACKVYADTIGQKYGITVRIWEDAVRVQPWDYSFQPEVLAPVLQKELQLLDSRLAQYPDTVLQQTISHFSGLTVCLVRSIAGTENSESLSSATGIQFFKDNHAYVVITTGRYSEQALYHELYHVMETHILTESTALDQWEAMNPADFTYNRNLQESEIYLQGQTRAFVDHYSMVYPKEDRARVLENAMLPEKTNMFQSEYMQRKLTALCTGIREAYRLKKHPEILPWEQYLINPLTPQV